jgi:transposase
MPHRLKMPKIQSILALREHGWSLTRIAAELGVHRETVARYVRLGSESSQAPTGSDDSKPSKVHTGSGDSKPSKVHTGSGIGRSTCEPFGEVIAGGLEQGLSAQRIWQDLVAEHGFGGSYYSVMRFVRRLGGRRELPVRRLECAPGEEAQVDFGTGAPVVTPNGKRRRSYVFRIVLSHSRKGYSEAVFKQSTESFIRCLENAFWHFGGVPKTLVIDNLRAAVTKADWYEPELNPKIVSFREHYGVVVLPTRPYQPRHKGKIESGVKYVKNNGLKGRRFGSLDEENAFLLRWETSVADTRIHGTTQRQVARLFAEVEREALLPLPVERFPFFHEAPRRVHRDGHVEVDKAYYSVPPEYFRLSVWARWDSRLVRIFNDQLDQIAVHVKQPPGKFSTHEAHIAAEKIHGIERGTVWLLRKASLLGPHADRWAQHVIQNRGIEGVRAVMGLVHLAGRHPASDIDAACEVATSYGAFKLRHVRKLIERQAPKQQEMEFLTEHPIIRDLDVYDELVRNYLPEPTRSNLRSSGNGLGKFNNPMQGDVS